MKKKIVGLFLVLALSATGSGFKNPVDLLGKSEVYFSPEGGIREKIINEIDAAKSSIDIAVYNLTAHTLRAALVRAKKRGVKIRIVADAENAEESRSLVPTLIDTGMEVKLLKAQGEGLMHHKFALFDGKAVITGSYNWTNSAETRNYENIVYLTYRDVVKKYQDEFERLWKARN